MFKLIWFLVLAVIVASKIRSIYPNMDAIAWIIVALAFGAVTILSLMLSQYLEKVRPTWLTEEWGESLSIVAISVLLCLALYLLWDYVSPYLGLHFGPTRQNG